MPRDQLASLSHWSSAPGVTPAPCQTSGVSPDRTGQALGSSVGMDRAVAGALPAAGTDAPRNRAATDPMTNREKVNIAMPSQQSNAATEASPSLKRTRNAEAQSKTAHLKSGGTATSLSTWSSGYWVHSRWPRQGARHASVRHANAPF